MRCSITGEDLARHILALIERLGLPMDNCVGQAYDGASNMAGRHNGCAKLIQRQYPLAVYTHCKSHLLNLSLVKACTSVSDIRKSRPLF